MRFSESKRVRAYAGGVAVLVGLSACGHSPVRRYPLAQPRWEDADRAHVEDEPQEYYSGLAADLIDKSLLRPLARSFYLPLTPKAYNVNAVDEVPNSSWFQNRLGLHEITPEEMALGPCAGLPPLDTDGPWQVFAAKPNGASPGFFVESAQGRFMLKFDGEVQPERNTGADVIASKFYWAAGYHAPCNEIVYFSEDILTIAEDATTEDGFGEKKAISSADVIRVLASASRRKDGTLRATASRFLPGRPKGPFKYQGRRADDPNDHVPHEYRRELRGSKIMAAWLHHHDAREQNTLDIWVEDQGRTYIRHYMLDFSDCLGGRWELDSQSRRTGHTYVLDWEDMALDYITLGAWPRPWYRLEYNPEVEIFGYFTAQDFRASQWKTDYPNAAHLQARYDDELWMARIISRFTPEQIRAVVEQGQFENPRHADFMVDALLARQFNIMQEYFTQYSPLDRFRLVRREPSERTQSLCFEDRAMFHGLADPRGYTYKAKFYGGERLETELGWLQFQPDLEHPERSCIQLPIGGRRPADLVAEDADADDPKRYGVLKVWVHKTPGAKPTSLTQLYFYDLGVDKGYRLVGIERPETPSVPAQY